MILLSIDFNNVVPFVTFRVRRSLAAEAARPSQAFCDSVVDL